MEQGKELIVGAIVAELTICYANRGLATAPGAIYGVAVSLADAIDFVNADMVHTIFRKAKDIETIPTQKTLKECLKNYHEEFTKYASSSSNVVAIDYEDSRAAWLPKEFVKRKINLATAIKNLCVAMGGDMYIGYCRTHATRKEKRGDREVTVLDNQDAAEAWDSPIKEKLREFYSRYIRMLPMYEGYPADKKLSLGIIPPTVSDFKWMLGMEASRAK